MSSSKPVAVTATTLPQPRFRYSPCVKAGPHYRFAGMVALDSETGTLESGGPGAETAKILQNLLAALPELGLALDDMVSATIFTTAFDRFPAINEAWEAVFSEGIRPPARTAVGVHALPLGATVEISFEFYKSAA